MALNKKTSEGSEFVVGEARARQMFEQTKELPKQDLVYTNSLMPHLSLLSTSLTPTPKITFLYTVQQEHTNGINTLHGGCIATLFDYCTSVVICLVAKPGFWEFVGVSRTLNTTYLRPAEVGAEVEIECELVAIGRQLCQLRGTMRRRGNGGEVFATCEHGKFNMDGRGKL
ncbi:putative thioesterase superfamily member [Podospora aff. communis PSN243]|uniref:Thioesterase superfamily member n=1 Tax=Podospora aff. communis PSN243 TaxID=3040156 RepID=A0AAV9GLC2_9PEZI|nr:putative thioesterase superfamily member [Podospora aff. communis PSN243]